MTHVLGQEHCDVDMAARTAALLKRGLVSLPRVHAGLVPLSFVVPPTSPLLQRDCTERFDDSLAFDARLRGRPPLHGRFLGDLRAKGFDHGWRRKSTSRFFCGSKKKKRSPAPDFRHQ